MWINDELKTKQNKTKIVLKLNKRKLHEKHN